MIPADTSKGTRLFITRSQDWTGEGATGTAAPRHLNCSSGGCDQLAQDVREYAAVAVILSFLRSINARFCFKLDSFPVRPRGCDFHIAARSKCGCNTRYREGLLPRHRERIAVVGGSELQRQNTHLQEIGAMNSLEAFGDHRANTKQERSFGSP